MYKQTKIHPQL